MAMFGGLGGALAGHVRNMVQNRGIGLQPQAQPDGIQQAAGLTPQAAAPASPGATDPNGVPDMTGMDDRAKIAQLEGIISQLRAQLGGQGGQVGQSGPPQSPQFLGQSNLGSFLPSRIMR